jgi:hypothetical protein
MAKEPITAANIFEPWVQDQLRLADIIATVDERNGQPLETLRLSPPKGGMPGSPAAVLVREEIFVRGDDRLQIAAVQKGVQRAKEIAD